MLDRYSSAINYPSQPVVISLRRGIGRVEIRDCREYVQRNIYFLGYYEWRESRLVSRLLRPGDVFVDAGANIGWFTLLAAHHVGPAGRVVAFEPARAVHAHLKRNISLSGYTNVTALPLALADYDGVARLRVPGDCGAALGTILETTPLADTTTATVEEVKTARFDDYHEGAGLESIRLMKIDVEGAELRVLRGMQRILARQLCDYILVEVGDDRLRGDGWSSAAVLALLRQYGYRLFRIGMLGCSRLPEGEPVTFANLLAKATRHTPGTTRRAVAVERVT